MGPLWDELLHVKRLREDEAIKIMQEKQLQLDQCKKNLEARIMEHDEYIKWRKKEERRLYTEILDKEVRVHNLNMLRDQIASFQEKQQQLKEEIEQAQTAVAKATEDLTQAREVRMEAYKTVQKYEEFKDIMETLEEQETERREELEAEEFTVRKLH